MPTWRNWQTRQTQNLVSSRTCRFDPGRRYNEESEFFSGSFFTVENKTPAKLDAGVFERLFNDGEFFAGFGEGDAPISGYVDAVLDADTDFIRDVNARLQ